MSTKINAPYHQIIILGSEGVDQDAMININEVPAEIAKNHVIGNGQDQPLKLEGIYNQSLSILKNDRSAITPFFCVQAHGSPKFIDIFRSKDFIENLDRAWLDSQAGGKPPAMIFTSCFGGSNWEEAMDRPNEARTLFLSRMNSLGSHFDKDIVLHGQSLSDDPIQDYLIADSSNRIGSFLIFDSSHGMTDIDLDIGRRAANKQGLSIDEKNLILTKIKPYNLSKEKVNDALYCLEHACQGEKMFGYYQDKFKNSDPDHRLQDIQSVFNLAKSMMYIVDKNENHYTFSKEEINVIRDLIVKCKDPKKNSNDIEKIIANPNNQKILNDFMINPDDIKLQQTGKLSQDHIIEHSGSSNFFEYVEKNPELGIEFKEMVKKYKGLPSGELDMSWNQKSKSAEPHSFESYLAAATSYKSNKSTASIYQKNREV